MDFSEFNTLGGMLLLAVLGYLLATISLGVLAADARRTRRRVRKG